MNRKHPLSKCEECPLKSAKYVPDSIVPGGLVLVGEAPGYQEVRDQQAFSANYEGNINAGYVLWESAKQLGLQRESVTVTNVVLCQTPGNRDPSAKEVACCSERLNKTIEEADPQLILALGKVPFKALTGKNTSVKETRNRHWEYKAGEKTYLLWGTYHPAGTLYNQSLFPDFVNDLDKAIRLVTGRPVEVKPKAKYVVLKSLDGLRRLNDILTTTVVVDLETTALDRRTAKILCVVLYSPEQPTVYILPKEVFYEDVTVLDDLLKDREQIYHNAMFDVAILRNNGVPNAKATKDTMLLHFCIDDRRGSHGLKSLAVEFCDAPDYEAGIRKYIKNKNTSYEVIPTDELFKYAALDGWYTGAILPPIEEQARKEGTIRVHDEVMLPAAEPLMALEYNGIQVDVDYVQDLRLQYEKRISRLEAEISDKYGDINPRSPMQIKKALVELELVPTDYSGSTEEEVLLALQHETPDIDFPSLVLAHRGCQKNLSTYINGVLNRLDDDGRVRSNYLLHGTVTGRLASRDPNMQNIPRTKEMRDMFCARPGHQLVNIDYSQYEFRMMGWYAQDPVLYDIYKSGGSIHKDMAIQVYGEDYDDEDYARAKMINFGVLYGRGEYSLSLQLGCSTAEAAEFIDIFFGRIKRTKAYRDELVKHVLKHNEVTTALGRKRRFPLITPANAKSVIKETLNFQPQSTASDLVLMGMAQLHQMDLVRKHAWIVNTMHDSLLFDTPEDKIPQLLETAPQLMERLPQQVLDTDWPFTVETSVGPKWGSTKEVNLGLKV